MAGSCSVVCTILLLSLYLVDVQADISLPSFGNRTYVSKGSDVTLAWTYDFGSTRIALTQWIFSNGVKSDEVLADIIGGTVTIANSSLPNINVIQPATLVLKNVSLDYNGTYTFQVTLAGVSQQPSSDIQVIVLVEPVANISCTTPVNVTEGGNFSCICSGVNGNPPATAYWLKDNNSTPITEGYLSAQLDIKNASKNDNGTYTCRAQSATLTDEQRVDLTVFVRPVANISCTTPVNVREGENVSCICSGVNGNPPATAYWFKDNNSTPIREGYVNAQLDIKNVSKNDNGTYICRVQSGPLTDEQRVGITVFVRPVANISCTTPVNITEGENVSCICSGVNGNPPATAYWFKDNNSTPIREGYVNAQLDIKNISKNDNGTYTCRAESGPLTDEQRVGITVFDKPVADVTCNTSVFIEEGMNFSCTCSGNDGSPPPSITWLKDDDKLTTVDNILKLRNISKLNNGTYVCRVQSGNLKKEKRVDVTVLYQPRSISFSSNEPNNNFTSGTTVKITCKADAYPEASYNISFNGFQLTDVVNGSYTISSVNDSHAGNYTCVAKNSVGNVSAHFVLTVKDVDECLQASICPNGSFCVNTVSSYMCNCNEGLYKNKTGQCVKAVPYRATFKLVRMNFTVDLKNSSSPLSRSLKSNLTSAISSAYQNNSFFRAVRVNGFSEGCVVADVTIIFNASQSLPLAELEKDVRSDGKLGNYAVEPSSIKLVEARPTPTPTLITPTRTVYPSASMSTTPPVSKTTEENSNIPPIVGGAIGGVVFLAACIGLIWYCCCKRSGGGGLKRRSGVEQVIVENHTNPSYAAMGDSIDRGNAYESVDQAKIEEARAADEAGPSNESPPDAGNGMPPVYAVVDKLKKTPKPPPEKPPADSLTYASLDPVLLQPDSSKMRVRTHEDTTYASIDLEKLKKDQE